MNAFHYAPSSEEENAARRLEAAVSTINTILDIFQSPSFSVGVLHRNRIIFTKGFGFYDKETNSVPNAETIYSLGSCTKAFTATAVALLAQQGHISLEKPISDYLPTFDTPYAPDVGRKATLVDLLTHSSGLAPLIYAVLGKDYEILTRHENVVHACSNLPCVAPFRSEWLYNNWGYALAARLVDEQSRTNWTELVHSILHELSLRRTRTGPSVDKNIAKAYIVLSSGRAIENYLPSLQGGDAFDGSGAIRSCVKDMLEWCKVLIEANSLPAQMEEDDSEIAPRSHLEPGERWTRHDLLRALRVIRQPWFPFSSDTLQSYGLGLYTFHMPTTAINSVTNSPEVMNSYTLGEKSPPRAAIGHTGALGSFTCAYWVFPDTESAVVVLTNASSVNGDPSNIVAQVLIQALFSLKPEIDFISIAGRAKIAAQNIWRKTCTLWWSNRQIGTDSRDRSAYVGSYKSTDLRMTLHITMAEGQVVGEKPALDLCIDGLSQQKMRLYHYHHDTWTFFPGTLDECLVQGLGIYRNSWRAFNLEFTRFGVNNFRGMQWSMDLDARAGSQVFSRVGP